MKINGITLEPAVRVVQRKGSKNLIQEVVPDTWAIPGRKKATTQQLIDFARRTGGRVTL